MNSSLSLPSIRGNKKQQSGTLKKTSTLSINSESLSQTPLVHRLITHSSKLTNEIQTLKSENEYLRKVANNSYELFYSSQLQIPEQPIADSTEEDSRNVIKRFCIINNIKTNIGKIRAQYGIDDRDTMRKNASIVIQKHIRRRQVQIRYSYLRIELIKWRKRHHAGLLSAISNWMYHQDHLHKELTVLRKDISGRIIEKSFKLWKRTCVNNIPFRRRCKAISDARYEEKMSQLRSICFHSWKSFAVGPDSQKRMRIIKRKLSSNARERAINRLHDMGEVNIIPSEDLIYQEYCKESISFMSRFRINALKVELFHLLRENVSSCRNKSMIAVKHHFKKEAGRVFFAWSDWIFEVSTGLDRLRWPAPRQFEVLYNVKSVACFTRMRLLKYIFYPWKIASKRLAEVSRRFRKKQTSFLRSHLVEWRRTTMRNRLVKRSVLDRWENAKKFELQLYFRFWLSESQEIIKTMEIQDTIVNAHCRCRMRRFISTIFKTWKHQTVYGRIDGMYTRLGLLQSLSEQKSICSNLELLSIRQAKTVEDMNEIVRTREKKILEFEQLLCSKESEFQEIRMALHNSEQEICRLKGIIEAFRLIAPSIMNKLLSFQEVSGFKNRNELYDLATEQADIMEKAREIAEIKRLAEIPETIELEIVVKTDEKEQGVVLEQITWDGLKLETQAEQKNIAERAIAAIDSSAVKNMPQVKQVLNDITDAVNSRLAARILTEITAP